MEHTETIQEPMGRILVIGGGGFIGRHVIAAFRGAGAEVAVMDMAPLPPDLAGQVAGWTTGSLADERALAEAARGARTVVFLANASLPGSSHDDLAGEIDAHVRVSVRAAEICESLGVARFLFASSGGTVYGTEAAEGELLREDARTMPRNAYGVSKLAIEHYLRLLDGLRAIRTISLRISNPYGEGQRARRGQGFVAAAMQHAVEGSVMQIWGDGSVERDFLHVEDVAAAFVAAARYEGRARIVNIGSGEGVSMNEMLERVEAATGRRIERQYHGDRAVDVRRNALDVRRALGELGWRPRIGLEEGLGRTARWWLEDAAREAS